MKVKEKVLLAQYSTMGLGGKARYFASCNDEKELLGLIELAKSKSWKIHVLGDGANTVFRDNIFDGLVIKINIKKFRLSDNGLLTIGAGENWDEIVDAVVANGWSGIEALSYIPGTVGAAPVQNIGAYGQELSETFVSLRAYDADKAKFVQLDYDDMDFSYRTSKLKSLPGRYIVTEVTLQLHKQPMQPPFYTTLQVYFDKHKITDYSPKNVRDAVVNWRKNYLPDYKKYKTAGSFFINPIVSKQQLDEIVERNPAVKDWPNQWYWQLDNGKFKVAAGRLADSIGLKDFHDKDTGMSTWKNSALILINEKASSYKQLDKFRTSYLAKIQEAYGISFEQEPVEI